MTKRRKKKNYRLGFPLYFKYQIVLLLSVIIFIIIFLKRNYISPKKKFKINRVNLIIPLLNKIPRTIKICVKSR